MHGGPIERARVDPAVVDLLVEAFLGAARHPEAGGLDDVPLGVVGLHLRLQSGEVIGHAHRLDPDAGGRRERLVDRLLERFLVGAAPARDGQLAGRRAGARHGRHGHGCRRPAEGEPGELPTTDRSRHGETSWVDVADCDTRRRSHVAVKSAAVDNTISCVDTAATTGLSSNWMPSNMTRGSVGAEPATNIAITISSNEVRNAKMLPLAIPGQTRGRMTSTK